MVFEDMAGGSKILDLFEDYIWCDLMMKCKVRHEGKGGLKMTAKTAKTMIYNYLQKIWMNLTNNVEPDPKKSQRKIAPFSSHHLPSQKLLGAHQGLLRSSAFQSHVQSTNMEKSKLKIWIVRGNQPMKKYYMLGTLDVEEAA